MSYSQWGHKESSPNRHGRGEGKGVPAPGKNARGKKAKYSKTGSSRNRPLPKRAQAETPETENGAEALPPKRKREAQAEHGKPSVRASQVRSARARIHGNPNHHIVGRR